MEAIEGLKFQPYSDERVEQEIKYIAKKLDFSEAEFKEILALAPHWYTDYPNDEAKLNFVYNLYRKLFKKEKLASF